MATTDYHFEGSNVEKNGVYFYFYFGDKPYRYKTFDMCSYQLYRKARAFYRKNNFFLGGPIYKHDGRFARLFYIFDFSDYKYYKEMEKLNKGL